MSDNAKTFRATEMALNELFNPEVRADLGNMRLEQKSTIVGGDFWSKRLRV